MTIKIATVTLNPAIDQTVSVPHFQAGKVNRAEQSQSDPGGKGVNVASILADCGYDVTVTGFLGEENTQLFERLFARKKIADQFVRIAGPTRTGIKIVDEITQETTDINFPGQTPTAADIESLFQIVDQLATDCQWFVLAGSIPAGVPDDIYCRLIERIKAKGGSVALDTSGEGFRLALSAGPDVIKPNIDELQQFIGRSLDNRPAIVEAAQNLLQQGMQSVVVSMGEQGALFVEPQEVVLARPPKVTVKSTVGAGDAMVSGIVVSKTKHHSLTECAGLATAFSAAAITHLGSGLPSLEVVDALKQQVAVETIN